WSSDVCSSDLYGLTSGTEAAVGVAAPPTTRPTRALPDTVVGLGHHGTHVLRHRRPRRPYRAALPRRRVAHRPRGSGGRAARGPVDGDRGAGRRSQAGPGGPS